MKTYKEKNWREIVRDLKAGPHFGIHGAKRENLLKMLELNNSYTMGHYFVVGEHEKSFPDSKFYDRLWASLDVVYPYSCIYQLEEDRAIFTGLPSILLGVEEGNSHIILTENEPAQSPFNNTHYGKTGLTFRVGHDFLVAPGKLRLEGIMVDESELELINRKLARHTERMEGKYGRYLGFRIEQAYFVEREIIRSLVKKIHKRLK